MCHSRNQIIANRSNQKHEEIMAEYFPGYAHTWRSLRSQPARDMLELSSSIGRNLKPKVTFPEKSGAADHGPRRPDYYLEFDDCYVTQVLHALGGWTQASG